MQRSILRAALQLQSLACNSGLPACTRAASYASHASTAEQQHQSQDSPSLPSGPMPTVPCLLRGRQSLLREGKAAHAFCSHQFRSMAGNAPDNTTQENTWLDFRTKYAEAKPNDLGQAMYAMILTFGFAALLTDVMAYPPRVVMMLGVVFYVLYMRR